MRTNIDLSAGVTAINTGNSAFYDQHTGEHTPDEELDRIVEKYASSLRGTVVLDINGNSVGRVGYVRRKAP